MAKYSRRPAAVDAWQWLPDDLTDIPDWIADAACRWPGMGGLTFERDHADGPRICLATPGGVAIVNPGDWIIKSGAGEMYPVRAESFAEFYQPVAGSLDLQMKIWDARERIANPILGEAGRDELRDEALVDLIDFVFSNCIEKQPVVINNVS